MALVQHGSPYLQQFMKGMDARTLKIGSKMPLKSKTGSEIVYECTGHNSGVYQFNKTIKKGDRTITGYFTYMPGKGAPLCHGAVEETPRGTIGHRLSYGNFSTPYGLFGQLSEIKLNGNYYHSYGSASNPYFAEKLIDGHITGGDSIMPSDYKSAVEYIRNNAALEGYFKV